MEKKQYPLFVSTASHLENILCAELNALGLKNCTPVYRGVLVYDWTLQDVYLINYMSRVATRVLLPLHKFKCFNKKALYDQTKKIDWTKIFRRGHTLAIDANVKHRELKNSLFAAQVVKDAICDQLKEVKGWRPDVDVKNPDIQLALFIEADFATISFDTSGHSLSRRGYRVSTMAAPLQESLAAALLLTAGFEKEMDFLDPCCGSGTILVEAALIASSTPPGFLRKKWGFFLMPEFNQQDWLSVKNRYDGHRTKIDAKKFRAYDVETESVFSAKKNLKAAGFKEIDIAISDFRELKVEPKPNFIITNPPYGKRLSDIDSLKPFYRRLGEFFKKNCAQPGKAFAFIGNLDLCKEMGLAAKRRHIFNNGGLDSRLLEFEIYNSKGNKDIAFE